jgi:hypothetical protein
MVIGTSAFHSAKRWSPTRVHFLDPFISYLCLITACRLKLSNFDVRR